MVGVFSWPGQIPTNQGGPYAPDGTIAVNSDWIEENGPNWAITFTGPKVFTLRPSQFVQKGNMYVGWVQYVPLVDWSAYTITATRLAEQTVLSADSSGIDGTLATVDMTMPEYAFLSQMTAGLQGPPKKTSHTLSYVGIGVGVLFIALLGFFIYRHFAKS